MLHRTVKKNDVNKDKWIGVGGHMEAGESPEDCVYREVLEETGLKMNSYQFRALVTFVSDVYETEYMCLFTSKDFEGEMTACDEGELEWVKKNEINQLNLWEGDKVMFQLLDTRDTFFSLKLIYQGSKLVEVNVDGEKRSI